MLTPRIEQALRVSRAAHGSLLQAGIQALTVVVEHNTETANEEEAAEADLLRIGAVSGGAE